MRDFPRLNWHKRLRQWDDKEVNDFTEVHVPIPTPAQQAQIRPAHTPQGQIRNFCIIAHIDHGKSTLADRMLQLTGVVEAREMRDQYLDRMDIERERGITIKSQAVRMPWAHEGTPYALNMIDTPGHVDFTYEVSRSLAACEGAVLLIDAAQGIEAQTLANLYLALENDLAIIPVLNKIDLPGAQPEKYAHEVAQLIGCDESEVLKVSGKTGEGVEDLLDRIVEVVPAPEGAPDAPTRAMIFDSVYDTYRGVVTYVRVVDGVLSTRQRVRMMSTGATHELLELGVISPEPKPEEGIGAGEVGYLITGVKDVRQSRVGDTVTSQVRGATEPLEGYRDPNPMVFSGIYPVDGSDFPDLRDALERLQLNDAALTFEPESSAALGFGFRCGFLGLLHLEIIRERLEREFDMDLITTAPTVVYEVVLKSGEKIEVENPSKLPDIGSIETILEPIITATILVPQEYVGNVMTLCNQKRGVQVNMQYMGRQVMLTYDLPMNEVVMDFFDKLKSTSRGYASLDYHFKEFQPSDLIKLDIMVNGEKVDALSLIVHRQSAVHRGRELASKMRELIPRQMFDIAVQAAIGSQIIARENVKALRKNVLAKCYGGDITRKKKLLEKQKAGKRRMKQVGNVEIPQSAFLAILQVGDK